MAKKKTRFDWVRDREEPVTPRVERLSQHDRREDVRTATRIAKALESVSTAELATLPLSELTRTTLAEVKRLHSAGKSALRRARLRLAASLRMEDLPAIDEALGTAGGTSARDAELELLVRWRTRILDGGDHELQAFVEAYPKADRQRIRQVAANARRPEGPPDPRGMKSLMAVLREAAGV